MRGLESRRCQGILDRRDHTLGGDHTGGSLRFDKDLDLAVAGGLQQDAVILLGLVGRGGGKVGEGLVEVDTLARGACDLRRFLRMERGQGPAVPAGSCCTTRERCRPENCPGSSVP